MDYEKIEIDLKKEEQNLLDEIIELQKKMKDVDPAKMNGQLMTAIQSKSIETITMALGVSDIFENTAHNTKAIDLKNDFEGFQKWENSPIKDRSYQYKPKFTTGNEFQKMLDKTKDLNYYRNDLTGDTFKNAKKELRFENPEGFTDAYTGKHLKHGENYHYEHVTSTNEISQDKVLNYTTTLEERRKFANSKENLVAIDGELNQSLGNTKIEDLDKWKNAISKKDPTKTNKEYFEVDNQKMKETIETSIKAKNQLLKNKSITYGMKSKTKIAASNAIKSGAKAAVGQLLSITVVEVINEYKKEEDIEMSQRIKNISIGIKEKSKNLLSTFKDQSISSFLSTFLDAILNSLFKIAKNIFKFVKLAIVSILKSIKILFSNEYPWEVRLKEAMKILGVAVASLIGLALDEIIEKALITNFPFTTPFAGYISPVLSGLIVGIGSVLILQGFQKYQSTIVFNKLQGEENSKLQKLSNINLAQAGVSDVKATESISLSLSIFQGALPIIESCKNQIDESFEEIKEYNEIIKETLKRANLVRSNTRVSLNKLRSL